MKLIKLLAIMLFLMSMCLSFTACGSDDDDELGGSINTSKVTANAVYTTDDGDQVVLKSLNSASFSYDEYGLPTKVDDYRIDYDEGVLWYTGSYTGECEFSMNNSGFITAIKGSYTYYDSYYKQDLTDTETFTYTYDSSGHLTTAVWKWTDEYPDQPAPDSGTQTTTYTWSNNNLTKVKSVEEWKEYDNEWETGKDTYLLTISYDEKNPLGQYTGTFAYALWDDYAEELGIVGLMGKAPKSLITEVYRVDDDGYEVEYEVSYKYNTDGTIKTETVPYTNGSYTYTSTYNYTYRTFTSSRSDLTEKWAWYKDSQSIPSVTKEYRKAARKAKRLAKKSIPSTIDTQFNF